MLIEMKQLAALEETLEILSDPDALADIRHSRSEVDRGYVVRGADAVRALRRRA